MRPQADAQEREAHASMLGVELGVFASLIVLVLLIVTTKLRPEVHVPDAECILPKAAASIASGHGYNDALQACNASFDDVDRVYRAHREAERVEGFVPKGETTP